MTGSHRAEPRPTGRLRRALTVAAIVAAVIGGGYALTRSHHDDPDPGASDRTTPTTQTPTGSAAPTVTPTATPTRTATSTPSRTAKPLPRVTASAPKRLVVSGVFDVGFDSTVTPKDGVLTPRSTAEVARWGGRGVPGSPSRDTVFIIGKVSSTGAFARLPRLDAGTRILLRTQTGRLTYTVRAVAERRAAGLTHDPSFARRVPGRLQLVGIRYDARGDRTGRILVVTAVLTGARPGT